MKAAYLPLDHYIGELLLFLCILDRISKNIDLTIFDSIEDLLA